MKEVYRITLHSQMGPREGTLSLEDSNGHLCGVLSLLGHQNPVRGVWKETGTLMLSHSLRTAVGEHSCRSVFILSGDALSGTTELAGYKMAWSGKRLRGETTEEEHRE